MPWQRTASLLMRHVHYHLSGLQRVLLLGIFGVGNCVTACYGSPALQSGSNAHGELQSNGEGTDSEDGQMPRTVVDAGCRSRFDCLPAANGPNGFVDWECVGPIDPVRCGPVDPRARTVGCDGDSSCKTGHVCRRDPTVPQGWASSSGLVCASPCGSDRDCAPTDECESGGHCAARRCSNCPSFLSCTNGICTNLSCSTDLDCPGGHCVNESCSAGLGVCRVACL